MTVKELQDKLAQFDEKLNVTVYSESDDKIDLFEITDLSLSSGTPSRGDDGKARFVFDSHGPVKWLFLNIDEA